MGAGWRIGCNPTIARKEGSVVRPSCSRLVRTVGAGGRSSSRTLILGDHCSLMLTTDGHTHRLVTKTRPLMPNTTKGGPLSITVSRLCGNGMGVLPKRRRRRRLRTLRTRGRTLRTTRNRATRNARATRTTRARTRWFCRGVVRLS